MYVYLLIGKFNIPPWSTNSFALEQLLLLKTDLARNMQRKKDREKNREAQQNQVTQGGERYT